MSDTQVPPIAGLGIYAVELSHSLGQIAVRCLDQQVVVIIHEAPGMTYPVELCNDLLQSSQKRLPVLVVLKNVFAPVPARGDVVERIGKFYADGAGHGGRNITACLLFS